ncbi:hypothetical protein ACJJTC_017745 [Scirpophaga incertulas]
MGTLVNKNLLTLKCVLFCFLSGIGCIYPFLPVHMLRTGLNHAEARLISAVAPCVAILGPAVLGCLIDKLSVGRGSTGGSSGPSGSGKLLRIVTAMCLILSALTYTLLLAVPYTERHRPEARRPQVLFMCDADNSYVMQEVCKEDMRCNRWSGVKSGVLAVTSCEYGCADENMTWLMEPYVTPPTTTTISVMYNNVPNYTMPSANISSYDDDNDDFEIYPPHLCYDGQCIVYMQHAKRMLVPMSLIAPEPLEDNSTTDGDWCTYTANSPSCAVPAERLPESSILQSECKPAVRCQVVDPYDEPDGVLVDAECQLTIGDPAQTFIAYLIIRMVSDIWPTAALALLGAACVIATRETSLGRGDVGRQLAAGTLGLAVFPPLAGLGAQTSFVVPFAMHAAFMLLGALILIVDWNMPLSTPEWWWHTSTGMLALPMNAVRRYGAETAAVFGVMALLGTLWSGIDAYLPWTILDLNGTMLDIGLTMTAGALPALPALWWAEALVDYIGHSNVFITAFAFYCLRYTRLAYSTDYAWVIVSEVLEVFTMSLVWVTAVLYFRHLVPRKYTTMGQALPVIAHFCIAIDDGVSTPSIIPYISAIYNGLKSCYLMDEDPFKSCVLVTAFY